MLLIIKQAEDCRESSTDQGIHNRNQIFLGFCENREATEIVEAEAIVRVVARDNR
jgi:hypothetical protein